LTTTLAVSRLALVTDQKVVLIVQHGEKEPFPGDPGLTAKGRRQAGAAGSGYAALISEADYSSPGRTVALHQQDAEWSVTARRLPQTAVGDLTI
jgi:hypothetical protein